MSGQERVGHYPEEACWVRYQRPVQPQSQNLAERMGKRTFRVCDLETKDCVLGIVLPESTTNAILLLMSDDSLLTSSCCHKACNSGTFLNRGPNHYAIHYGGYPRNGGDCGAVTIWTGLPKLRRLTFAFLSTWLVF